MEQPQIREGKHGDTRQQVFPRRRNIGTRDRRYILPARRNYNTLRRLALVFEQSVKSQKGLFNSYTFGKISGAVNVEALHSGNVVCQ